MQVRRPDWEGRTPLKTPELMETVARSLLDLRQVEGEVGVQLSVCWGGDDAAALKGPSMAAAVEVPWSRLLLKVEAVQPWNRTRMASTTSECVGGDVGDQQSGPLGQHDMYGDGRKQERRMRECSNPRPSEYIHYVIAHL